MTRFVMSIVLLLAVLAAPALSAAQPAKPYQSEMREQCEAELAKDARWNAELMASLRPVVHEQEANLIAKNEKHVIMAYAVLWILAVGFLVMLWMRQRRLLVEIAALERQVEKAARE